MVEVYKKHTFTVTLGWDRDAACTSFVELCHPIEIQSAPDDHSTRCRDEGATRRV